MARIPALCIAAIAITGCAVTQVPGEPAADRVDVDSYRLLGDLALARQNNAEAAEMYLNAALISDDPGLAERTVQMAYGLGLDTIGHRAIARWRELDPNNPRADYFAGIFELRSGRADAAVDNFAVLIDSLSGPEIGTGLFLIYEALSSEPAPGIATRIMRDLNARYPGTREGHYALAQLALRAGAFELALTESEAALGMAPDWPEARLLRARTLLLAGRSDEALAIASRLADELDNTGIRLQFAELLLSAGESSQAETLLDAILDENPGLPEAIRARAFLSLTEQSLDEAREQFEMLRTNPSYRDEAFYYLGRIAEMESDYLEATRAYARVTDGTRAVEAQIRTSALMYQEMGDAEGALRHLRGFGDANPRFAPEMLLAQAELLLRMEQPESAIALIDAAIGTDTSIANEALKSAHIRFYVTLMEDALTRGDVEAAETWINEGLARYPGDQNLRYSEARLLQEQGRLRRAVGLLEDLVSESPDNPVFLNALGYLLTDRLDRHVEARNYIQRALAMDPDSGAILDSMGWVLFRLGELELALDYLERAYRALAVTEVAAHLIDVHFAMGDEAIARRMLEEGLSEAPGDPYLVEVRDRLRL